MSDHVIHSNHLPNDTTSQWSQEEPSATVRLKEARYKSESLWLFYRDFTTPVRGRYATSEDPDMSKTHLSTLFWEPRIPLLGNSRTHWTAPFSKPGTPHHHREKACGSVGVMRQSVSIAIDNLSELENGGRRFGRAITAHTLHIDRGPALKKIGHRAKIKWLFLKKKSLKCVEISVKFLLLHRKRGQFPIRHWIILNAEKVHTVEAPL